MTQALSLVFGIEAIIILKDIWGLDAKESRGCGELGGIRPDPAGAAGGAGGRDPRRCEAARNRTRENRKTRKKGA